MEEEKGSLPKMPNMGEEIDKGKGSLPDKVLKVVCILYKFLPHLLPSTSVPMEYSVVRLSFKILAYCHQWLSRILD